MEKCSNDRFLSNSDDSHNSHDAYEPSLFSDASPFGDPELRPFARIIRDRAAHAHHLTKRLRKIITSTPSESFHESPPFFEDRGGDPWKAISPPGPLSMNGEGENSEKRDRSISESSLESLYHFSDYHLKFGLFRTSEGWFFREWAPNAQQIFILSPQTNWEPHRNFALIKKTDGIFEGRFAPDTFSHKGLYRLKICWPDGGGDRIPTAARRVVQDPETLIFNAQVWEPDQAFVWHHPNPRPQAFAKGMPNADSLQIADVSTAVDLPKPLEPNPVLRPLLIYETHVGMALEEGRVGTYREFQDHILPKIKGAGYNTIQFMAFPEHPYYGSFGYHVSSFFAPSSRFGTPDDLKSLIDTAHGMGFTVLMDIIHSHSVRNEVEGLSRFDGTPDQFFHSGSRGYHPLWDSRCFNYASLQVIRFLLSNLRYWLEEFNVDGFRFDGVTSMLFLDHGLGRAFTRYDDYFGPDLDQDALSYLTLANRLVHAINPNAVTIAEDVSGYPGLAAPVRKGGVGFDFRFAMGIADHWIKLLKDTKDEEWEMGRLWYELTTRRKEERTLSYAECHDQALVGDQTLMMRLMGGRIYTAMDRNSPSIETFRAVALHKMIRLITLATAHSGYLTFMGNEFGHPEWIDFPSERNQFSFDHARRQWSLKYDPNLYFSALYEFDRQMIALAKGANAKSEKGRLAPGQLFSCRDIRFPVLHEKNKIIAFERNGLIFVFNFHPTESRTDYLVETPPGKYTMILDTDEARFGGPERLQRNQIHFTMPKDANNKRHCLSLYLPCRCALVLARD